MLHQPLAGRAVEIEIHADLARTAERHEDELGRPHHALGRGGARDTDDLQNYPL